MKFQLSHKLIKLIISTLMVTSSVYADNVVKKSEQSATDYQNIETISVHGQRPLIYFRKAMESAKYDFFDTYNMLVSDPKFKVDCYKRNKIGSRIMETVCEPQYAKDERSELTKKAQSKGLSVGNLTVVSDFEIASNIKALDEAADQEKIRLISNNPELKEKFMQLIEREAEFKKQHVNTWGEQSRYAASLASK